MQGKQVIIRTLDVGGDKEIKAPKNPELTSTTELSVNDANVVPWTAKIPPTNPTAKPGLSAILIAIYPANIYNITLNAAPPTVLKNAATGVFIPKLDGFIE